MAAADEDELMTDLASGYDECTYEDISVDEDPVAHSWPRFQGTQEEYLTLIQDVVGPYEQLLQLEGGNLRKHLLNIHGLKALHYTRPRVSCTEHWASKTRWRAKSKLTPHSYYTAWPEEPSLVPKRSERFAVLAAPIQTNVSETSKSSEALEEEILAEIQRQARETFYYRASEAHNRSLHGSTKINSAGNPAADQLPADPQPAPIIATSPSFNDGIDVPEESPKNANTLIEATEISEGTLHTDSSNIHSVKNTTFNINLDLKPSIMLDEDKTKTLSRPIVRTIIQTTDKLLNGLARMRKNHTAPSAVESLEERNTEDGQSRGPSESIMSSLSSTLSLAESDDRHHGDLRKQIKPMDWSEMLGAASLLGFDDRIVARAHQRCETIFQESMRFHQTNDEVKSSQAYDTEEASGPESNAPVVSGRTNPRKEPAVELTQEFLDRQGLFQCPEITCERFKNPFRSIEMLSTHVQQSHGYLYELGPPHGNSNLPEWMVDLKELCCPFKSCKNHGKDFSSNWRLMEHMKRKHRIEPRKISAKPRKTYTYQDDSRRYRKS